MFTFIFSFIAAIFMAVLLLAVITGFSLAALFVTFTGLFGSVVLSVGLAVLLSMLFFIFILSNGFSLFLLASVVLCLLLFRVINRTTHSH